MTAGPAHKKSRESKTLAELYAAARKDGFALPRCTACGHCFYPAQTWCPRCLSPDVEHRADSGEGEITSVTELHVSFEGNWKSELPIHVACVRLAAGVSVFALLEAPVPNGTTATVRLREATASLPAHWFAIARQ